MGIVECRERLLGEGVARGEFVAVAEDGAQRLRDRSRRGHPADKVLVDVKGLEPAMQPLRPARVGMAVGDEGAIFELGLL